MKFNTQPRIFLIIKITIILFSSSVSAVSVGTYDHKNQTAFIVERGNKGKYTIVSVNFGNKRIEQITSGRSVGDVSVNSNRDILSYLDRGKLRFVNIKDHKNIFDVNVRAHAKPKWSKESSYFSYYDMLNESILEINTSSKQIVKIPFNGRLLHTKWEELCGCFLYQVTAKKLRGTEGHLNGQIKRNINGKLKNYKGFKSLTMSPNNKYYYEGKVFPEMGNTVSFYKSDGDKLIATFLASTSLANADVMWGKDTVRFLYEGGVFDLKTGKLLTFTHNFWPEESPNPKKLNSRKDVAADWKNHVLMWNKDKNVFEVEDINTGKIVKTYEKFWN